MAEVDGVRTFNGPAEAYDAFMGRYSRELAPVFADFCELQAGHRVLDVGSGPGAFGTGRTSSVAGVGPFRS